MSRRNGSQTTPDSPPAPPPPAAPAELVAYRLPPPRLVDSLPPLVSATYIPGHDTIGVGIPPLFEPGRTGYEAYPQQQRPVANQTYDYPSATTGTYNPGNYNPQTPGGVNVPSYLHGNVHEIQSNENLPQNPSPGVDLSSRLAIVTMPAVHPWEASRLVRLRFIGLLTESSCGLPKMGSPTIGRRHSSPWSFKGRTFRARSCLGGMINPRARFIKHILQFAKECALEWNLDGIRFVNAKKGCACAS